MFCAVVMWSVAECKTRDREIEDEHDDGFKKKLIGE
jgi:hypothetical protein